jgi:hypothetical protein
MSTHVRAVAVFSVVITALQMTSFAEHQAMPPGMSHEEHQAQMRRDAELKRRGAAAMGFDQDATTHHFRLAADGGSIEVDVKDPADDESRRQIRAHLKEIASEFASGDFTKPFVTHGEVPPGVESMRRLERRIAYRYEDTAGGGRVRITTSNAKARDAVQQFLRYQIREHGTGDPR